MKPSPPVIKKTHRQLRSRMMPVTSGTATVPPILEPAVKIPKAKDRSCGEPLGDRLGSAWKSAAFAQSQHGSRDFDSEDTLNEALADGCSRPPQDHQRVAEARAQYIE